VTRRARIVVSLAAIVAIGAVARVWTAYAARGVAPQPAGAIRLPDGRTVFSDAVPDPRMAAEGARALFARAADDDAAQRLTFGAARDSHPVLLADGRIGFERAALSDPAGAAPRLLAIHPDGTGVAVLAEPRPAPAGATVPTLTSVVDRKHSTGTLLCLDVYTSRLPEIARLRRSGVARVRCLLSAPAAGTGEGVDWGNGEATAILGEAPVAPDGSFFIEVPADTPLRLVLLGADGAPLASLDRDIWVRPNEHRGCVGCHEPPDQVPDNRRPMAVSGPPTPLAAAAHPGGAHASF
jgi:Hydrazine synthase alpha subunit middle domain